MNKNNIKSIKKNNNWEKIKNPTFTIITPVYNRSKIIKRTFDSVQSQSLVDFEYIIIDDGSTDDIDNQVWTFMNETDIPVLYIKKINGGVHTARNLGIKYGRGKYSIFLDSDDELTKEALEISLNEWSKIPRDEINDYYQIKGLCINEKGILQGEPFDERINSIDWKKRKEYPTSKHFEHIGVRSMKIMKENPWPEPDGVKFVEENLLWDYLNKKYKSWYFNGVLRIYHTEDEDHISKINKAQPNNITLQKCRNILWKDIYYINNKKIYTNSLSKYIKRIFAINTYRLILKKNKDEYYKKWILNNKFDRIMTIILYIPSIFIAKYIEQCKM